MPISKEKKALQQGLLLLHRFLSVCCSHCFVFREIFAHLCHFRVFIYAPFCEILTSCSRYYGHLFGILRALFSLRFGMAVFINCGSLDIIILVISIILVTSRAFIF